MSKKLPPYSSLFQPVLDALKSLGGSAKPVEVHDYLASHLKISDEALEITKQDGGSLFLNRIQWARFYLAKTGYIGSSKRGVWSITEKGQNANIQENETREIIGEVSRIAGTRQENKVIPQKQELEKSPEEEILGYRQQVLELLYEISASGFEKLCQRLLRESGFENVVVSGRSGDGGIDGDGVLQLNPFVSFRVLFQCKRYRGSVGAPIIRDFRGAMMGRADKGIILTTGSFTQDARREASRDGVPPIELVDGNDLISLFENLEFGLIPKQTYEVDTAFFKSFKV